MVLQDLEGRLTRDGGIQRANIRFSKSRGYSGRARTLTRLLELCFFFVVDGVVLR
jgi:hypothetical protein